ncbi:Protein CBG03250 [Caenorhabditis briggsae]|uniref:ditrans,polycis-polyprenyl diphosphate synthase [(2E,6E)-farnesyldiphosphate specific] n=1 Tax=Caenorhabditis briggsae TaxID=6238 RepID=A8WSG6_CAEBR|nr:Protein CBG03250 [Caenorhabditis briggsae]CAP23425.2 Protein CBG03250 [Caenorhabditis briggsae]
MLDVAGICVAAVRAVYWLVMLVCNFLGYSPLWAQIAMKNRKMENVKIRIPAHLAVCFTESRLIDLTEVIQIMDSCVAAGIRQLSLYDPFGELVSQIGQIEQACRLFTRADLFCDGKRLHSSGLTNLQVNVLSRKMGKSALVEACKMKFFSKRHTAHKSILCFQLCREEDEITVDRVSKTLEDKFHLSDPDFLLQVGNVPTLCGYPPWNLRITEFLQTPRLPCSRRALDCCVEAFSQRDIRVGK